MEIRRLLVTKDVVYSEAGRRAPRPITRAIALAVIHNPFAGRHVEDLSPLFDIGAQLAELVMPQLLALLPRKAESYGKGAIVGVNGDAPNIKAINAGQIAATAALLSPEIGNGMGYAAKQLIDGKKLPTNVAANYFQVTKENIGDYKSYEDRLTAPMKVTITGSGNDGVLDAQVAE